MNNPLHILPEELRTNEIGPLSDKVRQMQDILAHAWSRLDSGWENYAESGIQGYYHEAMNEIGRMTAMLEQMDQALKTTASEIGEADQKTTALFSNLATNDPGGSSGKPPGLAKMMPPDQNPPSSELEKLLREMLDGMCPADPTPLLDAIHNATLAERQAILNDPALMEMIQQGLGSLAPVYIAALLEGALYWPRGSWPNTNSQIYVGTDMEPADNDFWSDNYSAFAQWMRSGEENTNRPDTLTGTMNCWEYVLYATYLAGNISYDDLVGMHAQATASARITGFVLQIKSFFGEEISANERAQAMANAYYDTLGEELGVNDTTAWQIGDPAPPAGSLIFFNDLEHVAISTGRMKDGKVEIMSLWVYPMNGNEMIHTAQMTTIEDLLSYGEKTVTYGPNHPYQSP